MLSYSWAWTSAILVFGTGLVAVPWLAFPIILMFVLCLPFILIWGGELLAHDPAEEIRRTKRHQFLGRGGPDDPFAGDPYDE